MPKFSVVVPHRLAQDEALARVKAALADAKARYGDQVAVEREEWNGYRGEFAAKAMGMRASGTIDVRPTEVAVEGNLPLLAAGFKGQIEERLRERATALLA